MGCALSTTANTLSAMSASSAIASNTNDTVAGALHNSGSFGNSPSSSTTADAPVMPAADAIQDVKPSFSPTGKGVTEERPVQQSDSPAPCDAGSADEKVKREADVLNTPN